MPQAVERQLRQLFEHHTPSEKELLSTAIEYAKRGHEGQVRSSSGKPYVIHPMEVAVMLEERFQDSVLTIAALLHDVVEDCDTICMKEIYQVFGNEVGFIVDSVTKTECTFWGIDKECSSHIDKLLFGGMKDVRCLLLKLADRENNLQSIDKFRDEKQMRISFETQAVYLPLKLILCKDGSCTLQDASIRLQQVIEREGVTTSKQLEDLLFGYSFTNLNREFYHEVYSCSHNVVWELSDLTRYEQLCSNTEFCQSTKIISIHSDGKSFRVRFKFQKVYLHEGEEVMKFKFSHFSTA